MRIPKPNVSAQVVKVRRRTQPRLTVRSDGDELRKKPPQEWNSA